MTLFAGLPGVGLASMTKITADKSSRTDRKNEKYNKTRDHCSKAKHNAREYNVTQDCGPVFVFLDPILFCTPRNSEPNLADR